MAQRRREFGGIGVTKGDTLRRVARHLSSQSGRVVELADTKVLKTFGLISVRVQVPSLPPMTQ